MNLEPGLAPSEEPRHRVDVRSNGPDDQGAPGQGGPSSEWGLGQCSAEECVGEGVQVVTVGLDSGPSLGRRSARSFSHLGGPRGKPAGTAAPHTGLKGPDTWFCGAWSRHGPAMLRAWLSKRVQSLRLLS